MKNIYAFIAFLFPIYLGAQQLVGKIPLTNSGIIKKTKGFALGDSIYFCYEIGFENHSLLISPDRSVRELDLPELDKKAFLCLTEDQDSLYFNFLEKQNKKIVIQALGMSKKNGEKNLVKAAFVLEELIIGRFYEEGVFRIATIDQRDSTFSLKSITKNVLQTVSRYKLPGSLFKNSKNSSLAFINEGMNISASAALASIKIYCSPSEITISESIPTVNADKRGVTITRIKRDTGNSETKFFKQPDYGFTSFFFENELFWISKKKGLNIIAVNWKGEQTSTYTINKETSYINDPGPGISTVLVAVETGKDPFIAPYRAGDGSLILKVGTRNFFKQGLPIPVFGSVLSQVALRLIDLGSRAVDDGISLDYYFYLKKEADNYSYINSPDLTEEIIRSYEANNAKDVSKKFKYDWFDYFNTPNGVIGISVKNVKQREFELVRYTNR